MAVRTYSIPEKNREELEIEAAVRAHCKKHHMNISAVIVSLLRGYAIQEGIINERGPQ